MLTSIIRALPPLVQPHAPARSLQPEPVAPPDPVAPVQDADTGQTTTDNPAGDGNSGAGAEAQAQPAPAPQAPPRSAAMELAMTAPPGAASLAAAIKTQNENDPNDALAYARRLALAPQTRAQVEGYVDRIRPAAEPEANTAVAGPVQPVLSGALLNRRA